MTERRVEGMGLLWLSLLLCALGVAAVLTPTSKPVPASAWLDHVREGL